MLPATPLQVVTSDPDEITPAQRMLAGAMAGACAQSTIYPFELVRRPCRPLPALPAVPALPAA
jgi:hypothetical protein